MEYKKPQNPDDENIYYNYHENNKIDPRLKLVLEMIDNFSRLCFDKEIIITSLYRPEDTDSIHSKGRAADIRTRCYRNEQLEHLEDYLFCIRDNYLLNKDGVSIIAVEPHEKWKDPDHPKYKSRHLHVAVK